MAPKETRADPVELAKLADAILGASQHLDDAWLNAQAALALPENAFGDSVAGPGLHLAHQATTDDAGVAVDVLVGVLENDTDSVYRVAFAFQQQDLRSANSIDQTGTGTQGR